ncbi:MAG: hypothetical protein FJ091_02795 [Deltaproteobacteria bacterium]|nr:hypothetical protein [Deltaproteobacteria bacterium]
MLTARLTLAAVLAALLACAEPAPAPEEVALEFWSAAVAGDAAGAAQLASPDESALAQLLGASAREEPPAIGAAAVAEDDALVETMFLREGVAAPLRFHTHLARGDAGWLVQLRETADELARAQVTPPAAD